MADEPSPPDLPPPAPPTADQIRARTVPDPDAAFAQLNLDDAPQLPPEESLPPAVRTQIIDATSESIGEHDPEHPQELPEHQCVPTKLPAEVWHFPQYEGVDFVSSKQLSNLKPPNLYNIRYNIGQDEKNPQVTLTYVTFSYVFKPGKSPRDRLLHNGGLLEATYMRTTNEFLLGRGGYGFVYKANAHVFTEDVPNDTSLIDVSKHLRTKEMVIKEIVFTGKVERRTYSESNVQPANDQFTTYFNASPYEFTVAMLCNYVHICTLYDYTNFAFTPHNAEGLPVPEGEEKLWVGFMEYLRGGDLSLYYKRWRLYKALANEVLPEGQPFGEPEQQTFVRNLMQQPEAFARYGACPEVVARTFMQQLYEAIFYLHQMGVAHMDLKPGNLMFDHHGTLKLVDFGLSHPIRSGTKKEVWALTNVGTPAYMAPEVMRLRLYCDTRDPNLKVSLEATKADLYSMAVIVFLCVFGCHPIPVVRKEEYEMKDGELVPVDKIDFGVMLELMQKGQNDRRTCWLPHIASSMQTNATSDDLFDFVFNGLSYDPNRRVSAYWALAHPQVEWLAPKTIGVDALHDYLMKHGTIVPK